MGITRRPTEDEIEEAVDTIMEEVNEHEFASPNVPRSASIEFYDALITRCREHKETLEEELEAEGEGDDDGPSDDDDES